MKHKREIAKKQRDRNELCLESANLEERDALAAGSIEFREHFATHHPNASVLLALDMARQRICTAEGLEASTNPIEAPLVFIPLAHIALLDPVLRLFREPREDAARDPLADVLIPRHPTQMRMEVPAEVWEAARLLADIPTGRLGTDPIHGHSIWGTLDRLPDELRHLALDLDHSRLGLLAGARGSAHYTPLLGRSRVGRGTDALRDGRLGLSLTPTRDGAAHDRATGS